MTEFHHNVQPNQAAPVRLGGITRMKTCLLFLFTTATLLHAQSTNVTVVIRGKSVTSVEVERIVREHATKQKIVFDFDHSIRTFLATTNPASANAAHLIFFHTNETGRTGRYLTGSVTRDGGVSASEGYLQKMNQ